jgi:ankyrin repeat protein
VAARADVDARDANGDQALHLAVLKAYQLVKNKIASAGAAFGNGL